MLAKGFRVYQSRRIEPGFLGLGATDSRSKPRCWILSQIINIYHIYHTYLLFYLFIYLFVYLLILISSDVAGAGAFGSGNFTILKASYCFN
jgi:hypothetical protein